MSRITVAVVACAFFLSGMAYERLSNASAAGESHTTAPNRMQDPKYDPNNPATWPASLDPVVAAPDNHTVLLENERVRVLDVTVRPGEKERVHAHRWPSVLYIYSSEDFLDYDGEGKVIRDSRSVRPARKYPVTLWQQYQPPHAIENLSRQTPIRLIRVEIKK